MIIRRANNTDIPSLMSIFAEARATIAALGIDQWQDGYPYASVIEADIKKQQSYAVSQDEKICAAFALIDDGEPAYDTIYGGHWLTGDENRSYLAIHRVAISVANRGNGISGLIIGYASDMANALGKASLRIDTHEGNIVMRKMLEKNGFVYCGIIYLESGEKRVAYEKLLEEHVC